MRRRQIPEKRVSDNRYVARGTTVENKRELLEVLRDWLNVSDAPTIGTVANYGGKPWIAMHLRKPNGSVERRYQACSGRRICEGN
jgi:hypothetical protein